MISFHGFAFRFEKHHKNQPEHINSGQQGNYSSENSHAQPMFVSGSQNNFFREKPCEWRNTRNGNGSNNKQRKCKRNLLAQTTHVSNVLFVAQSMNYTSCSQEKQCFKKCMCG